MTDNSKDREDKMNLIYRVLWTFDARPKCEDFSQRKDAMRRANDLVSLGHLVRLQKAVVPVYVDVPPSKWDKVHS